MKTRDKIIYIISIILFISIVYKCNAQPYANFSFDMNKAFHLKDNPRTVNDVYGLDYDIEIGARDNNFGVFMFYGQFNNQFRNYGAGVDYYINIIEGVSTSIGVAYSPTKQRDFRDKFEGVGMYSARAVLTYWIKHFGLSLRANIQNRTDVSKGYVLEGMIGLSYRL